MSPHEVHSKTKRAIVLLPLSQRPRADVCCFLSIASDPFQPIADLLSSAVFICVCLLWTPRSPSVQCLARWVLDIRLGAISLLRQCRSKSDFSLAALSFCLTHSFDLQSIQLICSILLEQRVSNNSNCSLSDYCLSDTPVQDILYYQTKLLLSGFLWNYCYVLIT